jgi:hypothetical protein
MSLSVTGGADSAVDAAADLRKNLHILDNGNLALPVHLVGQQALWAGMQDVSKTDLEKAEFAGFPVVFIILLAVFGSLAAALLPFSLGVTAVVLTGAAVYFLSQMLQMSIFVTNIASMLGIGVAVDYSLFILSRYREELHNGSDPETARDADLGPRRVRVRRDRGHLAGRPVPDRLQDDALDGDRCDRRRGHRGARGHDAAARPHQDARGSRLRAGPGRELGAPEALRPAPRARAG